MEVSEKHHLQLLGKMAADDGVQACHLLSIRRSELYIRQAWDQGLPKIIYLADPHPVDTMDPLIEIGRRI